MCSRYEAEIQILTALDPTMKNLREDPIEIEKDPMSLEDILLPAEAISTKIKSDAMNDVQGLYFRKPSTETMEYEQGSHFKQNSSPTSSTTAPKRSSPNKKQSHERMPKLRDLHPKDPTKVPHRYPKRGNRTVKSGQTLTTSDDDTNDVADNLPPEDAGNEDDIDVDIIDPPTDPTAPSAELQQQSSRHVTPISLNSPIHLSISEIMGRMKILSGKNLKLLFKTEMAM
jgi:hypothetical protein